MKPTHLSKAYGDQFQDTSIVAHYRKRPAYPAALFDRLVAALPANARIVDLGCGTGEISIPLAERGLQVIGVDPSAAMIEQARQLSGAVEWQCSYAEAFEFPASVDMVIAANSLHWMDWERLFPTLCQVLTEPQRLVLITGGDMFGYPGQAEVIKLVQQYSTNQDFKPYSLTELLSEAGFISTATSIASDAVPLAQPLAQFIDSFHARNGFSLDRMEATAAAQFRQQMTALLTPLLDDGCVTGLVQATAHFCTPRLPQA